MDISEEARASINFTKKKNDIVKEVEEPRATSVYNIPN